MIDRTNPMARLAIQALQDREGGEQRFVQQMKPQLERMIRRVLRLGASASPIEQKISRELDRSRVHADSSSNTDDIVGVVARRMCQELIDGLRASPAARPWLDTRGGMDRESPTTTTPRVLSI